VTRKCRSLAALGTTAAVVVLSGAKHLHATAPAPLHNKHFSHARMVVDGTAVVARVRLFKDDLEKALRQKVTDDPASKAVVAAYVTRQLAVRADDQPLKGEVIDQGGDNDGDQPVVWVMVQWTAPRAPRKVGIKDHLLFDQFDDQQNLVILARMPEDKRNSLYFQPGDRSEQVVSY
jgi:hypothetical protein